LIDTLGTGFVSLYIYGSVVDGTIRPGKSDLNLLLVTRALSGAGLRALNQAWPGDRAGGHRVNLVLLAEDQIPRAHDAFALELSEIRSRGRLLAGKDVLAGTETPHEALRIHVERELRVLGVRLRRVYLGAANDPHALASTLASASGSVLACARGIALLTSASPSSAEKALSEAASWAGVDPRPLLEAWRLRREPEPPGGIDALYLDFLDTCDRLLARVDALLVPGGAAPSRSTPHA
jgi:hypothetical protein